LPATAAYVREIDYFVFRASMPVAFALSGI
jgi:hypothetical protein